MYSLRLLGVPSVHGGAEPVTGRAVQRHRLALLALAGVSAPGASRERVLAYLWPESPGDKARASLNESVYVLRKTFGESAVLTSSTEIRLDPGAIRVDVVEFERAVEAGDWRCAERLYAGPFLDGFFLGGTGEFDRWVESERARLAQLYQTALEGLARDAQDSGDPEAAVAWWRRCAGQDPYDARIARSLMQALAAAGNRAGALEHARVHALLLRTDFDAGPDPEVEALAARIRTDGPTPRPGAAGRVAQVGVSAAEPSPAAAGAAERRAEARAPRRRLSVAVAVAVLLLLASGLGFAALEKLRDAVSGAPVRLAVLPFHALGGDAENDVLSMGIPDAIITRLAAVERIRVRPTSAVLPFAGRPADAAVAGRALGVEYVLAGTVQLDGGRVRVNVQLVRVKDGISLWGNHFHVPRSGLLAVQDQVAGQVASSLRLRLSAAERNRFQRTHTRDTAAHELYMRGRAQLLRRTEEATRAAAVAFDAAIDQDPSYALAHAGLALASAEMHLRYPSKDSLEEWQARAMRSAHRALDLDPELGEAHEALAAVFRKTEFDWARTIEESRRAIELNPSLELPYHYMAAALYHLGLLEEAEQALEAAEATNPVGDKVELLRTRGMTALWSGRFEDAVRRFEEAQRRSDRPISDWGLALAYFYRGETERAERMLLDLARSPSASASARAQATLASFLAARGETAGAEQLLRVVTSSAYMDHHVAYSVGVAQARLGQSTESVRWLRRAAETGFPCYPFFAGDPLLEPMRTEPEFVDLLEQLRQRRQREWHRLGI